MIEGLYTSSSGMLPKSAKQEVIANNLANIEVPGFKRSGIFMRELMEAKKRQSGDYPDWRVNRINGDWTDFKQGQLRETGGAFDVGLHGNGFFAVRTAEGVQYTRNGGFIRNEEGVLTTHLGNPVLDEGDAEIIIPADFVSPIIDAAGVVRGRDELSGEDRTLATLKVVDFPELYDPIAKAADPYTSPFTKSKDGYYIARPNTAQVPAENTQIVQGWVEESNVEAVMEMVRMIDVSRAYESDQKAIQIQDSTLDRAVNDLGVVR